jgi:hypothetical protein
MDPAFALSWVDAITRGGPLLIMLVVIYTGARGFWVWKSQHEAIVALHEKRYTDLLDRLKEVTTEREDWRELAQRGTQTVEQTATGLAAARRRRPAAGEA